MHVSTDCIELDNTSIEVIAKLHKKLPLICNECKPKKKDFVESKKTENENSEIDDQLQKLQEQMLALTSKMEQSNKILATSNLRLNK